MHQIWTVIMYFTRLEYAMHVLCSCYSRQYNLMFFFNPQLPTVQIPFTRQLSDREIESMI